jgi:hypothetical protein
VETVGAEYVFVRTAGFPLSQSIFPELVEFVEYVRGIHCSDHQERDVAEVVELFLSKITPFVSDVRFGFPSPFDSHDAAYPKKILCPIRTLQMQGYHYL